MKTAELTGAALDWAVQDCEYARRAGEGERIKRWVLDGHDAGAVFGRASTDWVHGGPIIEREKIQISRGNPLYFPQGNESGEHYEPLWIAGKMHGQTALIAAMRCYVASKLGDEVEIPKELL